ncbi:MAG: hypothetical protein ACE5NM_05050 [Sedimentisphaerales bacterium]
MRTTITLMIIAAILCLLAGCGPGQPFEIESLDTPQVQREALFKAAA